MPHRIRYGIDAQDRIQSVNEGWTSFARDNLGEATLPPGILGQRLWGSISDPTTAEVYRALLARVREGAGPVRFRFRCDSPGTRRLLEMRIEGAISGGVTFTTERVHTAEREAVRLLHPATPRTDVFLTACAWCARVRLPSGAWVEVEVAVGALELFDQDSLPRLSHGMCPECLLAMDLDIAGERTATGEPTTLGAFVAT